MKLWYRCEMCSPNQSRCFDVEGEDMSFTMAQLLVEGDHAIVSPNCPATKDPNSVVQLLVRIVQ
jgi:hypothetical protein